MATLKVYDGSQWRVVNNGSFANSRNHSLVISGDWRGAYITSPNIIVLPMDISSVYPNGITIASWYLRASVNDPVTEIVGTLRQCDAQGTGAFPGANVIVVDVLNTTTGNSQRTDMSLSFGGTGVIPAGKILYINLSQDPVDLNTIWTLTINFTAIQ